MLGAQGSSNPPRFFALLNNSLRDRTPPQPSPHDHQLERAKIAGVHPQPITALDTPTNDPNPNPARPHHRDSTTPQPHAHAANGSPYTKCTATQHPAATAHSRTTHRSRRSAECSAAIGGSAARRAAAEHRRVQRRRADETANPAACSAGRRDTRDADVCVCDGSSRMKRSPPTIPVPGMHRPCLRRISVLSMRAIRRESPRRVHVRAPYTIRASPLADRESRRQIRPTVFCPQFIYTPRAAHRWV